MEPMEQSMHPRELIATDTTLPFYSFAVRVLPDRDAWEEDRKLWLNALYKWQQVFEILNYPGTVGKALLQEQLATDPDQRSAVLRDSLGIKSPRTAIKGSDVAAIFFMAADACARLVTLGQETLLTIFGFNRTCQIFSFKGHDFVGVF